MLIVMKQKSLLLSLILALAAVTASAADPLPSYSLTSPDGTIVMTVNLEPALSYSIRQGDMTLVEPSPISFDFAGEAPMGAGLVPAGRPETVGGHDQWRDVVRNKHEQVSLSWNEVTLPLRERAGACRRMDLNIRVYDNGVAFRCQLYASERVGHRRLVNENTSFRLPQSASAWVTQQNGGYQGDQEAEFFKRPVTDIDASTLAGLPMLVEIDREHYLAITEAWLDNYPGFYLYGGREQEGSKELVTRLAPLPGEDVSQGVKARFDGRLWTPWRLIMIGSHPGRFIEAELVKGLNPPCAIDDPSWIKPGLSAWDHWWSGEVKMEMPVIKQYIDLASAQGWPYMLVDWQWYGPYNRPDADITRPAPQLDMAELLAYAKSRGVRLWLWLYCSDVNRNNNFEEAFALYERWGIAGVKIDFMNRNDQEMVNWYRRICQAAAEHHLMVDLHGAYRPDGIERTYPNLVTREGVLGEEYSKFSSRIVPWHNVTLAFTRMLAGPMDYTPGGFLNVTPQQFRQQSPTLVMNTRAAELSKFVIYDSPFTTVCDHPDHYAGEPGADFLRLVPTVWDDTRFVGGYPGEYVALAKRSGRQWFVGVMNNEQQRTLTIDTSFLPAGSYTLEYWADGKQANTQPTQVEHRTIGFSTAKAKPLRLKLANGGGYVAIFTPLADGTK